MPNVKVSVDYTIKDGQSIIFKAPCDCTSVTGLIIYYKDLVDNVVTELSKVFTFRDAHNQDLANIDNLFTEGVYVHAILDTTNNYAYLQNADTNSYLEEKICSKLVTYTKSVTATTDGQTVFTIDTDIDSEDTVLVQSGRLMLFPNSDFTISGNEITLVEGVPTGRSIGIYVLKNVVDMSEAKLVPISQGGTGSTTAEGARNNLGVIAKPNTYTEGNLMAFDANGNAVDTGKSVDNIGDAQNLKTYTYLDQIGITVGEETLEGIMEALPIYSLLQTAVTSAWVCDLPDTVKGIGGTLTIEKVTAGRASLTLVSLQGNVYRGSFSNNTWSGWKEIAYADEYQLKAYYGLNGLGLTNEDFDATDFTATVTTILNAMPNGSLFTIGCSSNTALNLFSCINDKINSELGTTYSTATQATVIVKKWNNTAMPSEIEVIYDSTHKKYECVCETDSGTMVVTKFAEAFNPDGYLPLTGGTLTGNLQIVKAAPEILMRHTTSNRYLNVFVGSDNNVYFRNAADSNNRTAFYLQPETATDITRMFRLQKMVDGTANYYSIYGEHNITKGTADLTAGTSPLATGAIYLQYE